MKQRQELSRYIVTTVMLILLAFAATGESATDFETHVFPIFEAHCISCHGKERQLGNFRIDEERFTRRRSGNGFPILSSSVEESELYQRIISEDPDHRMPRDAEPLTIAQIAHLKTWLAAGAPWPQEKVLNPNHLQPIVGQLVDRWNRFYLSTGWLVHTYLLFLFAILVIEHRRGNPTEPGGKLMTRALALNLSHYALVTALFALMGIGIYHHVSIGHLQATYSAKHRERLREETNLERFIRGKSAPLPPRPMHPARLGGVYFRGNDERSPALFNGGFYLTATLDVSLVDADGNRMEWMNALPARGVKLRCRIEKAKGASPILFSDRVMGRVFLSTQWLNPGDSLDSAENVFRFTPVEKGQSWKADVPLESVRIETGNTKGVVYIYTGVVDGRKVEHPQARFGMVYDLHIVDGLIARKSELWLGSLISSGHIYYPPEGKIPVNEWLDFRPMPVIEGTNSTDSKLLGLDSFETQTTIPASPR
jgi:mono/diheme cytochrome c family protein